MNKRQYHVDLADLMRVYETNYAKLRSLLPRSNKVDDQCCYQVEKQCYQIKIIEVTVYTTLIDIWQVEGDAQYPLPKLTVRLYHDAKVAEVCAAESLSRVKPCYQYPNVKMLQKDEKLQLNRFLGDWLTFCLKRGVTGTPII